MSRPADRPYTRYTADAIRLLGRLVREARLERKETAAQLAERAGVSRGLLLRIERGDPGCSIGATFEVAALSGIRLFGLEHAGLVDENQARARTLTLLPRAARPPRRGVSDDF